MVLGVPNLESSKLNLSGSHRTVQYITFPVTSLSPNNSPNLTCLCSFSSLFCPSLVSFLPSLPTSVRRLCGSSPSPPSVSCLCRRCVVVVPHPRGFPPCEVPRHLPWLPSQSMASTLNSVSAANSSSGNANSTQNSSRPSLRPSASTKGDGRRQSGSPVDGGQRYVPTPTAHEFDTSAHLPNPLPIGNSRCLWFLFCPHQLVLGHCVSVHALELASSVHGLTYNYVRDTANWMPRASWQKPSSLVFIL